MRAHTVAVLGAGSSGQAIAGFLALSGYQVNLWNRDDDGEVDQWLRPIADRGGLQVQGVIEGFAPIQEVTTDIAAAVFGAEAILVNTTADAYQNVGRQLAPHISSSQRLILMASGTLGTIDMWQGLLAGGFTDDLLVGETSTTLFGSRVTDPATVLIKGRKNAVEIASLPSGQVDIFNVLLPEFSFVAVDDVLKSGFNNTGPALHVVPMVLNAGRVEAQGGTFLYYIDGVTPRMAAVIEEFDKERLAVARAFGYESTTLSDYLTHMVAAPAGSLYQSIQGCTMYAKTTSPEHLDHRFLWEDTVAGVVPLLTLAEIAKVPAPISNALVTMSSALLGRSFRTTGRTARNLRLENLTVKTMKDLVQGDVAFSAWKQLPRPKLLAHNDRSAVEDETEAVVT